MKVLGIDKSRDYFDNLRMRKYRSRSINKAVAAAVAVMVAVAVVA